MAKHRSEEESLIEYQMNLQMVWVLKFALSNGGRCDERKGEEKKRWKGIFYFWGGATRTSL